MPDFSGRVKKNPILYPLDPKPWLKSPGLKSSWLKSLGLKGPGLKLGVEKSGVEMSFNRCVLLQFSRLPEIKVARFLQKEILL